MEVYVMDVITEVLIAVAVCAVVFILICFGKKNLLIPVRSDDETKITITVSAHGDGANLEHTVRGVLWLRDSGTISGDIVINDDGLTAIGRQIAEIMERKYERVKLCGVKTPQTIGDVLWEQKTDN
jgi:hypothetical protein